MLIFLFGVIWQVTIMVQQRLAVSQRGYVFQAVWVAWISSLWFVLVRKVALDLDWPTGVCYVAGCVLGSLIGLAINRRIKL